MPVRYLTDQQRVFKPYHSNKHFRELYLQDGGENQLAYRYGTKLRHCHPVSLKLAER